MMNLRMMRKALFVTYGGGHVAALIPVIRELLRRGEWEISTLGLTTARQALEKAGIEALGFRDLLLPQDQAALAAGQRLLDSNHQDNLGIPREETVAYLGLSYVDLEERLGPEQAARRFAALGRGAFLPLGPLDRVFRRVEPDIVVTTNSPRAEEAAIRTAVLHGIPSLCVVDQLFPESIFLHPINAFLMEEGYGDHLAVFSSPLREWLISHGRRPEQVTVTGNPAFDALDDPTLPQRAEALRRDRGWRGKKVILWASQPELEKSGIQSKVRKALIEAASRHADWHLILRKHPSEPAQETSLQSNVTLSDNRDDLAVQLTAVDVVVTMTSTVGIQGVLWDKPLVRVCLSEFDKTVPYESLGVALTVDRLERLEERLAAALSQGPESEAMQAARLRLPRPGTAAKRVADLVESMGGNRRSRAASAPAGPA
jgi:hypothetical protein